MSRGGRRAAAALLAVGLLATACGLPNDDGPRVIANPPFGLSGQNMILPPVAPGTNVSEARVWLAQEKADGTGYILMQQTRLIEGPNNLQTVLKSLLRGGVTQEEYDAKLRNFVPPDMLQDLPPPNVPMGSSTSTVPDECGTASGGRAVSIEVREDFFESFPDVTIETLAVGQIVLTAFDYQPVENEGSKVSSVTFKVNGHAWDVPTATANQKWISYINNRSYYDDLTGDQASTFVGGETDGCSAG